MSCNLMFQGENIGTGDPNRIKSAKVFPDILIESQSNPIFALPDRIKINYYGIPAYPDYDHDHADASFLGHLLHPEDPTCGTPVASVGKKTSDPLYGSKNIFDSIRRNELRKAGQKIVLFVTMPRITLEIFLPHHRPTGDLQSDESPFSDYDKKADTCFISSQI